jgi:hypothetical protein
MSRRARRSKPIGAESIFVMWPLIDPLDFSVRRLPDTSKRLTTGDPDTTASWVKSTRVRKSWSARRLFDPMAFTPIGSRGPHQNMILNSLHECESRMAQSPNHSN